MQLSRETFDGIDRQQFEFGVEAHVMMVLEIGPDGKVTDTNAIYARRTDIGVTAYALAMSMVKYWMAPGTEFQIIVDMAPAQADPGDPATHKAVLEAAYPEDVEGWEPPLPPRLKEAYWKSTEGYNIKEQVRVLVGASIDAKGRVQETWINSDRLLDLLREQVEDYGYKFRFRPAITDGVPVSSRIAVPWDLKFGG